ncbi:MAG: hypothetical protein F7C07_01865 [Desulfurococcales archaeon]|nr:hypothetical protein [Desulfurococcales archaeon]MCE4612563.1 hypothetical protein [Desulfurococcales archaeon]
MGKVYSSFETVYRDARAGAFLNEAELKQAFIEALKSEFGGSQCHKYIVKYWLFPALEETVRGRRPDIRISNIVVEVEPPGGDLGRGRLQLRQYMRDLYQVLGGRVEVYGLVTNGIDAELLEYDGSTYVTVESGDMPSVARDLIEIFCSRKIPVSDAKDLLRLFGV